MLNAHFEDIRDYERRCWTTDAKTGERKMNGTLDTLCQLSYPVGLYELTDNNLHQWVERLRMLEALHGPARNYFDKDKGEFVPVRWTVEDIAEWIGLRVNVAPVTDAQWWKNIRNNREMEAHYAVTEWRQAQKNEVQ